MSDDGSNGVKWFVGIVVALAAGVVVPIYLANRDDSPSLPTNPPAVASEGSPNGGSDDFDFARTPAHVYASKTAGPTGTTVKLSGDGYKPGEQVVLRLHTTELGRTTVDEAGKFQGVEVTVPKDYAKFAPQQFDFVATGETSLKAARTAFTVSG